MTNTRILSALCHPGCGDVIPVPPSPSNGQKRDRVVSRSEPLRQPIGRQDGGSVPLRQPVGTQDGGGGESGKSVYVEWPRFKIILAITLQGWGGQYKMYNSLVRHVTGNDQDYLRKIPRAVVQISALL
jgi:hypothetical protein